MTTNTNPRIGQAAVIIAGQFFNQPCVIVALSSTGKQADVLLSRTGERVTVRTTSLDLF